MHGAFLLQVFLSLDDHHTLLSGMSKEVAPGASHSSSLNCNVGGFSTGAARALPAWLDDVEVDVGPVNTFLDINGLARGVRRLPFDFGTAPFRIVSA